MGYTFCLVFDALSPRPPPDRSGMNAEGRYANDEMVLFLREVSGPDRTHL